MADGSLLFDTKVNTDGMKKDLQSVGTVTKGVFTADVIEAFAAKAGQAIVGLAQEMIAVGSAFETSMSQVAATMGITSEEIAAGSADFEKLSQAAKDMGATTKYTAAEAAEGLNILAMAGLSADESISTLPSVLALAAAGAMDMGTAASYVTGAVKGWGDNMENASKYADIMAKGATMANTDVNMLGAALSGAAANANAYGQSVESTSVALLRLAEQNVTGTEAATAMSRAMADLYTPTSNGAKALEELGVSAYDSAGNARDFNEVVDELNGKLSTMSAEQKLAYENTIFTTFGMKAFQKMTVSTAETVERFAAGVRDASGSAMQQMNTQIDNLEGKLAILNSATEAVGISFYEIFEDTMKGAVDSASDAMTRFQRELTRGDLGKSMERLAQAVGNFAESSVNVAEETLPKFINGLAWLADHSQEIVATIEGMAAAMATFKAVSFVTSGALMQLITNIGLFIASPAGLAAIFAGLTVAVIKFATSCGTASDAISELANEKLEEMTAGAKNALDGINEAVEETNSTFENLDASAKHMEALRNKLIVLNETENLSVKQKAEMAAAAKELNAMLGEEVAVLDEEGHLTEASTKAIKENVEAKIQQAKAAAAQEKLIKLNEELLDSELQLAIVEEDLQDIREERTKKEIELATLSKKFGEFTGDELQAYYRLEKEIAVLTEEEQGLIDTKEELATATNEANRVIDTVSDYLEDEEEAARATAEANGELAESMDNTKESAHAMSEEMQEAYDDLRKSVESSIESQTGLFEEFDSASEVTFDNVKKRLTDQITALQDWSKNIKILADQGINEGLLAELESMGPEGAAYVQAFVDMSADQLSEISTLYEEKAMVSQESLNSVGQSWYQAATYEVGQYNQGMLDASGQMQNVGDELGNQTLSGLMNSPTWNALSESAKQKIIDAAIAAKEGAEQASEVGELIPTKTLESLENSAAWSQMPESIKHHLIMANSDVKSKAEEQAAEVGEAVPTTMAESMEENAQVVNDAAETMATGVVDTINQTLGTEGGSSTVAQKIGADTDTGLQQGINENQSAPIGAATSVANAVYTEFKNGLSQDKFHTIGIQIDAGLAAGIREGKSDVINEVVSMAQELVQKTKDELGVASPSKEFRYIADMCVAGFSQGFEDFSIPTTVTDGINASLRTMQANASNVEPSGTGLTQNIYVNKEVSTASEMARAIRLESRYGLMRGTALGY